MCEFGVLDLGRLCSGDRLSGDALVVLEGVLSLKGVCDLALVGGGVVTFTGVCARFLKLWFCLVCVNLWCTCLALCTISSVASLPCSTSQ